MRGVLRCDLPPRKMDRRESTWAMTTMRALAVIGLALGAAAAAAPATAREPYEGYWAGTAAACRNEDSDDRLAIEGATFQWYETRCTASGVKPAGPRAWTMTMSCEGEGETFTVRPRVSLPSPARLVMENGPVGRDPKRQTYLRCKTP